MNRQEIKDYAVQTFGFEDTITVTIFAIDEACKDDYVALYLMNECLELGVRRDK